MNIKIRKKRGIALAITLIFILVFSSLSIAVLTMSSTNVQIASNHHNVNLARYSAESGCEYIRHWMSRVTIPRGTPSSNWFSELSNDISADLDNSAISSYDTDYVSYIQFGSENNQIAIDSAASQSFWARIERDTLDLNYMNVSIYGRSGELERTISTRFSFGMREESVFDYGMASKGPIYMQGNVGLIGQTLSVEADVYIESLSEFQTLSLAGKAAIAGDVKITNPEGQVIILGGAASIGGETGSDAIENHVEKGVPEAEFPVPNPKKFEKYVKNVINDETEISPGDVFENVRIAAGTNPKFTANVEFRGIVYIEQPNVVTFSGNTVIKGMIVADGDPEDNSAVNQINFLGGVESISAASLPYEMQYDGIRDEKGTFLMAPGFAASFGGGFGTVNGAISANGLAFSGNAGGIIEGSVLNYSDKPMVLTNSEDLVFNRSGIKEVPAGFEPEILICYNPRFYSEVIYSEVIY